MFHFSLIKMEFDAEIKQTLAGCMHSVYFSKQRAGGHPLTNPCLPIIFLCYSSQNLPRHGLRQEIFPWAACSISLLPCEEVEMHCSDKQNALG